MEEKLVRDKIPIIAPGCYVKSATPSAKKLLAMKLVEESIEFLTSNDVEELADVYEVLLRLARLYKVDLESLANRKRELRGGFEQCWVRVPCEELSTD